MEFSEVLQEFGAMLFNNSIPLVTKIAVVVLLAVTGFRKYLAPRWPWLASDLGAITLTWGTSLAGAVVTALVGGGVLSWGLLSTAAMVALQASGGYTALKKALLPLLDMISGKLPKWIAWLPRVLSGALGAAVIKKAEAAGDEAVAKKPATGIAGIVGEPRDLH